MGESNLDFAFGQGLGSAPPSGDTSSVRSMEPANRSPGEQRASGLWKRRRDATDSSTEESLEVGRADLKRGATAPDWTCARQETERPILTRGTWKGARRTDRHTRCGVLQDEDPRVDRLLVGGPFLERGRERIGPDGADAVRAGLLSQKTLRRTVTTRRHGQLGDGTAAVEEGNASKGPAPRGRRRQPGRGRRTSGRGESRRVSTSHLWDVEGRKLGCESSKVDDDATGGRDGESHPSSLRAKRGEPQDRQRDATSPHPTRGGNRQAGERPGRRNETEQVALLRRERTPPTSFEEGRLEDPRNPPVGR